MKRRVPHEVYLDIRAWTESESARLAMTNVSQPVEVACYSRGPDREIVYGSRRGLKAFKDPSLGANLGNGFHSFVAKDESGGCGVEPVVRCLVRQGYSVRENVDVVSFRNNLNKIGNSPYNFRDPYEFDATLVDGVVFLDIRKTDTRQPTGHHARFMYMGYKFEALCTDGRNSTPVNANEEFCAAVRLRVGNHRIAISAEMDAVLDSESDPSRASFVELKTTKAIGSAKDKEILYLDKYQKWFVQSFLAGVRTIFVGYRGQDGSLVGTDHVSTRSLSRTAHEFVRSGESRRRKAWEPALCINCIDYVLEHVRRACNENPGQTVRFTFDPSTGMLSGTCLSDDTSLATRVREVLEDGGADPLQRGGLEES